MRGSTNASPIGHTGGAVITGSAYSSGGIRWEKFGKVVIVSVYDLVTISTGYNQVLAHGLPKAVGTDYRSTIVSGGGENPSLLQIIQNTQELILNNPLSTGAYYGTLTYMTDE